MPARILTVLLALALSTEVHAQERGLPITPRVDTTQIDVSQIYRLWSDYLASDFSAEAGPAYWSASEFQRYPQYDISKPWLYGSGMYDYYKIRPRILSIEPADGLYAIRTLYLPEDLSRSPGVYSLQRVYAKREGDEWRLMNALTVLTDDWRRQQVGHLEYVMPADHEFDQRAAHRASSFVDSVLATFDLTLGGPIEYFIGRSVTEMAAISGLEFTWDTNDGRAYLENRQVFVATAREDYLHEIAHVLFGPLDVAWMIGEGLATYLGGFGAKSFEIAAAESAMVLREAPEIRFDDILNQRHFDFQLFYVTGALMVEAVLEHSGIDGLLRFLHAARTSETVYTGLEEVLGVTRGEVDPFFRAQAARYARD